MSRKEPENEHDEELLTKINEMSKMMGGMEIADVFTVCLNLLGLAMEQMDDEQSSYALLMANRALMRFSMGDEAVDQLEAELEKTITEFVTGEKVTVQ